MDVESEEKQVKVLLEKIECAHEEISAVLHLHLTFI
jgi:hypothetical protein